MTTIGIDIIKYVRFVGKLCGLKRQDCDFQGWDPTDEEICCDRYHDGPEGACPQLVEVPKGIRRIRCQQCLDEFKGRHP